MSYSYGNHQIILNRVSDHMYRSGTAQRTLWAIGTSLAWHRICSNIRRERVTERSNVKPTDAQMATLHKSERREERFALPFEIEVSGINSDGEVFHVTVQTRNVSQWGCGFLSPIELKKNDIVAIRVAVPEGPGALERTPIRFQVVRVDREERGWAIGAWKMESDDAWGVELGKISQPQGGDLTQRRGGAGENEMDESED